MFMSTESLQKSLVLKVAKGLKTVVGVGIPAFLFAQPATAIDLTWYLQNVRFDDGGTATGSFIWSTEKSEGSQLLSANITTTDGITVPGFTYDTKSSDISSRSFFNSFRLESGTHALAFVFNSPPISSEFDPNFILRGQETFTSQGSTVTRAPLEAGYVTTVPESVPEPSSILGTLTFAGLVGGIFLKRKLK